MDGKAPKLPGGRGSALLQLLQSKSFNVQPPSDGEANTSNVDLQVENSASRRESIPEEKTENPAYIPAGRGQALTRLMPAEKSFSIGRGTALSALTKAPSAGGRGSALALLAKSMQAGTSGTTQRPSDIGLQTKKTNLEKLPPCTKVETKTDVDKEVSAKLKDLDVGKQQLVEYHGTSGREIPLFVNCVQVKCQNEAVYQYHVSFDPQIDSRNMRFILLNQHRDVIGKTKAFDGSILYLPKSIGVNTTLMSKRLTDQRDIKIKIAMTQKLHPTSSKLIPFYNIVLKRAMHLLKMCPVGRNYYDPHNPRVIERYQLMLWPGYVTAIKTFEGGMLLNIDVSHKVLRKETARHVMESVYKQAPDLFKEKCIKELVGSVVLTRYNNKNYRIDDIAWNITPTSSFTNSKGDSVTFQEYYRCQYKIEIQDLLQPMLVHRPKRPTQRAQRENAGEEKMICLVPELCYLTGLSDKLRSDFKAMKEIKEVTCQPPPRRVGCIEEFLKRINSNQEAKDELLRWGLQLDSYVSNTKARQFGPESIMVGDQQVFQCGPDADFTREVTRSSVIQPVTIHRWLLIFTRRDANKADQFFRKMVDVCRKIGMEINKPHFIELRDDRSTSYKDAISSSIVPAVQLVVCIFPTSRDDRYSAVKKLCCVDMPVPSQVILSRTLPEDAKLGKFRSITMKIALQINCKLGGELWAVDIPLKGLMICGVDVYHDSGGKGNSVAAFVASTNKLLTRWYSRAIMQQPQQEVISSLKPCFTEAIKKFYEVNHSLPARVVIFRDGVGDGQLKEVAEHEVTQLSSCFRMFDGIAGGSYEPKLSMVIVCKRINVKLFAKQNDGLCNPPPGTVLDHLATRPTWPDFFLVSQHVRHGTVSPTHYIVVSGQEHLKADHMQRLAYKLTHMYYNWPGTVRVPAPCQYAHKLAYLVGQSIRQEPSIQLCDRLFYL